MLLHPVGGLLILLAILFVMFQAVFAWARPVMEAISDGFTWLGALVGEAPPAGDHPQLPEGRRDLPASAASSSSCRRS